MSRNFSLIQPENLRSPIQSKDIDYLLPRVMTPVAAVINITWSDYSAGITTAGVTKTNVNVNVFCQGAGPRPIIDKITSVKIDNTGNGVPVYVSFPDTTDVITCGPNTIVWEPVITNGLVANIIGEGFTSQNNGGATRVSFTNVVIAPYVNSEQTQSIALSLVSIDEANTLVPGYSPAALGDRATNQKLDLDLTDLTPKSSIILGAQAFPSFYYITNLSIVCPLAYAAFDNNANQRMFLSGNFGNRDTNQSLVPWQVGLAGLAGIAGNYASSLNAVCFSLGSMNLRLDARNNYGLLFDAATNYGGGNITIGAAIIRYSVSYTISQM